MEDKAPDFLEFENLKVHDEAMRNESIFKLEDPPASEADLLVISEPEVSDNKPDYNEEESSEHSNDELLNLHAPPEEEENRETSDSKITDELINQFAQNLIDPIVKEAIEMQRSEMEDSISDEIKVDSSGDKKSERSLSDDEFEYVKTDDIHSSTSNDQNNEEIHQAMESNNFNKDIEDESFYNEDMKAEDNSLRLMNALIDDESIVPVSYLSDNAEFKESDTELQDESYGFDLQDIINAAEANQIKDELEESPIKEESFVKEELEEPFVKKEIEKPFVKEEPEEQFVKEETEKSFVKGEPKESPRKEESEMKEITSPVKITASNISQKCKDVVCWKHPILSSIILSVIMLVELGLMCDYSIISLLAYSGLLLLCSSFGYKFAVKFKLLRKYGQHNCSISISSGDIQLCVDCVLKWIEYLFNEIRSLTYVVSFTKNLKAFTFFWLLTYVGQWFNLLSLIFMGTIIMFTLPIVYTTYKEAIDRIVKQRRDEIVQSTNKLKCKLLQMIGRRPTL